MLFIIELFYYGIFLDLNISKVFSQTARVNDIKRLYSYAKPGFHNFFLFIQFNIPRLVYELCQYLRE